MINTVKATYALFKLGNRVDKIIGKKNANRLSKFLGKRKGLGTKIVNYTTKKPASTLRRIKKINKALDAAPYVGAAGAGAVGISFLKGKDEV